MWFMPFQIKRQTSAQSAQGIKAFWNKIWQKQLLKAHKDSKHNGIKYSCDECDYGANTKSILKVNIESKHKNGKIVITKQLIEVRKEPTENQV